MDTLVSLQVEDAPEHPVLPNAKKYDLQELRLAWGYSVSEGAILEIEASTHDDYVVLRFSGVEDLVVPCGDRLSAVRIQIKDTSACPSHTHYIPPVRFGGNKIESDSLSFWAKTVERLEHDTQAA